MAKTLLIPLGGGGGGGDMSNYYTKQQIDAMLQGVQSIQGFQGIAGENGSQGIQGIKGSDGTNGVDGLQGIQGIAGQNGTNGVDGQQGVQGIKGVDGINGEQGIQGIKGVDGTNGQDGHQGIQGIAGQDGTNGVNGQQGIQGIKGIDGINGEQGIQGIAGQNGTNGVDGLQGIQGTMGIQGPAGGGGGGTRYDISTKSQEELADFYQNWETVMASNDVYVGIYPVTSVIPEYTVEEFTALLLEFNINFALEDDETTETPIVNGVVGAYYILPNGMGGLYGTDVPMASKDYVDAVVSGIQAIQGIQGTAGTNGVDGLQGIQGIQGASGGGGGGNAWYGTQAEFDALQSVDTNTDYFISDPITWAEIANKPNVPTKISELPNDEGYVTDKEMKNYINEKKIMHIVNSHNWYGTQAEYETLQGLQQINPDTNYFIEGDEVSLQMTFTFTDSTQAVYDVFVRPTV